MSGIRRGFAAGILVLTSVWLAPVSAIASGGGQSSLREATAHSEAGYLTKGDRDFLNKHPDLARGVIDPKRTTTSESTVFTGTKRVGVASATTLSNCYATNRYQNYFSVAGVKVWEYHTRANWCGYLNGMNIWVLSGTPTHSAYFDRVNFCWDVDAVSFGDPIAQKINSSQYQVVYQGKIHYVCAGKSLYVYPRNDVRLFGSGSTSFYPSR